MRPTFTLSALLWMAWWPVPEACTDGLIQTLPADGAWVRFNFVCQNENRGASKESFIGTLTVKSVGSTRHGGQTCRWIEFELRMRDVMGGAESIGIRKWLIPESELAADKDPRSHVTRVWKKDHERDVQTQDLEDAFLDDLFLPGPLRHRKVEEAPKTIEYQRGRIELTRCVTGVSKGTSTAGASTSNAGQSNASHWYWTADTVPFGVAAATATQEVVHGEIVSNRFEWSLEMNDYGTDAASSLPDHN